MADERAKIDSNWRAAGVVAGVTDNAALEIMQLRLDPTTKRLKVEATGALTQQTEDTAHVSGDTGTMVLAVRQDTQVDFGADGDYVPLSIDADGALRVSGGSTQYAVDAALGATPTGTLAIAIRDDALSALTPVEGDAIGLRVDANGALWTRDDVLEAAISGSEMQVDVVAALPAGTNAIGKLAANSGVDIGDVDVLSIAAGDNNIGNVDIVSQIPGTGATNLGKAVDSVAGATDTGVATLVVRDDALGALTPIEGDYVSLRVDANGALWTHDDALDAALAGTELQVDVVAALPAGTNAIGKLAANTGVDIGDVDILSIAAGDNNIGNVDVVTMPTVTVTATNLDIRDLVAADVVTVTGGAGQTADVKITLDSEAVVLGAGVAAIGKLAANSGVDIGDVDILSIAAGDNNIGNVDIVTVPAPLNVTGSGVELGALRVTLASDSTGVLSVDDNAGSLTVDVGTALPAGTNAIGKLAANSGVDIGDVDVLSLPALPAGSNNIGDVDILSVPAPLNVTGSGVELGALRVTIASDSTGVLSIDDNAGSLTVDVGTALPTGANAIGKLAANSGVDIGDVDILSIAAGDNNIGNFDIVTFPAGNLGQQLMAASLSVVPASNITDATYIGDIKFGESLPAGTAAIGKLAANTGVDIGDVDVTSIAAGANLVGDVGLSGARTSGGTTPYKNIDVDETEDAVKATAGQVYWIHAINTTAAPLYLKFYNATVATVVVGTTVPDLTFPVPANADSDGAGFNLSVPNGIAFGTAITIACTTAVADADAGAPGANACIVNLGYA